LIKKNAEEFWISNEKFFKSKGINNLGDLKDLNIERPVLRLFTAQ